MVMQTLTSFNQASHIKMYQHNTQSRLFVEQLKGLLWGNKLIFGLGMWLIACVVDGVCHLGSGGTQHVGGTGIPD